ncbi:hypothetical protein K7H94_09535 [Pantoea dispersa]|uniref:hypothetical protein n=1 Tax=Pantoea dispersa TaxID=59814 RepID=UPI0010515090|nr:hypothetical protein [Pantoea dispersa]MDI9765946.1 hypothetical protein [Pantoea dispersa]QZY88715.1 hypothetical protein K7H94_09535 [Pantoea dispersa]
MKSVSGVLQNLSCTFAVQPCTMSVPDQAPFPGVKRQRNAQGQYHEQAIGYAYDCLQFLRR